jgi:serine phosphatase RsbU (regulator of sigma subunit)
MPPKNIYDTDSRSVNEGITDEESFKRHFVYPVTRYLYATFRKRSESFASTAALQKNFDDLTKSEKQFWNDFSSAIPGKLRSLNLLLRPFKDYCRTCIITDDEITSLAAIDLNRLSLARGREERKLLFRELNYLMPASVKKAGYEIIRQEEVVGVNISMIRKIARAIHSRYLDETLRQTESVPDAGDIIIKQFDDLPAEIQYSNIDNATHLPTKLLSIGYRIRPARKGFKAAALHLNDAEVETMARVEHLRWSWEKRLNGWSTGMIRDEKNKIHPSLVPYDELDENEKEKDRELVRLIPAILQDINYEAYPVSPGRIGKLSYAIKPQSSVHKLLCETNRLGSEIKGLASSSPEINEKIRSIDEKIRLTISEVEGSYNYARHIQDTFLPEDLYIRECFPDSFVLYEPKDIVSGDFYFFSRRDDHVIFGLADCTGHGIPAALISTIGYGILDQAVNIMGITDPQEVLKYLYTGIHRFMRRDLEERGLSDDMDIVLCNLDIKNRFLIFSGSGNILLRVTEGKISENLSGISTESDNNDEYFFVTGRLQMKSKDFLYLCSDGYADQFGGSRHRRYSRQRLSEYLLRISPLPMPEQSDMLYEEYERWREEKDEDQTDDITVIGIRI